MLIVREVKGINFQIFGLPVPVLDGSGNNLIINISLIFPASFPHPWPWLAGLVCGNVTYVMHACMDVKCMYARNVCMCACMYMD